MRTSLLVWTRQLHLYLGVFTAPAILFFAFTGALQTFSLHENARNGSYQAPNWIKIIAQVHKKQTAQIPVRKAFAAPQTNTTVLSGTATASPKVPVVQPATAPQAPRPSQHNPLPMRIFFLVVGVSLVLSTFTGLWMSWKYQRNKALIYGLFLAGIIVPIVLVSI